MKIHEFLEITNSEPHDDENVRAYIDRISGGFVRYQDVAKELRVQNTQLYRWLEIKPYYLQAAVRSILFKLLAEQERAMSERSSP